MDWVWKLYEKFVRKSFARAGEAEPSEEALQEAFLGLLADSTVTILVQEPWQNSVRFKGLARHRVVDNFALIEDPMGYLFDHYGGGKFKLNFHHGWQFVATQNFKPQGEPRWHELPGIEF